MHVKAALMVSALMLGAGLPVLAAPIEIGWADLIPDSAKIGGEVNVLEGIVQHNQVTNAPEAAAGAAPAIEELMGISSPVQYRTDLAGSEVRISGYILPLEFNGTAVTNFLLVPFVGACVHVPPPPANQLVLVDFPNGFEATGLWQAVRVTGILEISGVSTELAEIGYSIRATAVQGA